MLRRFIVLLSLVPGLAAAQTPTWDQLKAVYDVKPLGEDAVKTMDRTAAEGTYTEFNFLSPEGGTCYGTFVRPNAKGPFPLVVMIHGLGDSRKSMIDGFAKDFLAKGFAVMAVDAPHHGDRATQADRDFITGAFMKFATSKDQPLGLGAFLVHNDPEKNVKFLAEAMEGGIRDVRRALDFITVPGHRVDPKQIGAFGISMGSIMSSILSGVDDRINADLLVIGGDPIAPFVGEAPSDMALTFAAGACSTYLPHSTAHVLMLNGYNDGVVPRADALRLYESAPGAVITFYDTPGGGFNGFGHGIPADGYALGEAWLTRMITVPKPATRSHAKAVG